MKVAIIGGGISGLMAAARLNNQVDYVLFEQGHRLGGHADTQTLLIEGKKIDVDTGFIVFNEENYPHFTQMIKQLNVDYEDSDMSFAVSNRETGLEYKASDVIGLFAQKKNFFNPKFFRMIYDIMRFYKQGPALLDPNDRQSVSNFFKENRYSHYFVQQHIMPMISALWSGDFDGIQNFPLQHMLSFMKNHNMLQITDRPQWKTITGGSKSYVKALQAQLKGEIRCQAKVIQVTRDHTGCFVHTNQATEQFDKIIFACHSDQALAMLSEPSDAELFGLGYIKYNKNQVDLHCDARLMPKNKDAWASWHVNIYPNAQSGCTVNYYMNQLQNIDIKTPLIVSLNQKKYIRDGDIFYSTSYWHPIYDNNTLDAQEIINSMQGHNNSYYCGAYLGWGFHEDGARSGVQAAEKLLNDSRLQRQAA